MDEEEKELYNFQEHYKIGQKIYYVRVMENLGINEITEGKLRTVEPDFMVMSEAKTQRATYIGRSMSHLVFKNRNDALDESHKHKVKKVNYTTVLEDD